MSKSTGEREKRWSSPADGLLYLWAVLSILTVAWTVIGFLLYLAGADTGLAVGFILLFWMIASGVILSITGGEEERKKREEWNVAEYHPRPRRRGKYVYVCCCQNNQHTNGCLMMRAGYR